MTLLSAKGVAKMVAEDVALGDTGAGIPPFFETTEQRLKRHFLSDLAIELDMNR